MDLLKSRPALVTTAGLVSISTVILILRAFQTHTRPSSSSSPSSSRITIIPSPRTTLLPHLSPTAFSLLPYPPDDALPGSRDVVTPHGTIKVFEFGPTTGERVLLLPGISTPCIALSNLALALVERGYRVMVFDYFGRGWSDTPDPGSDASGVDHDERLYIAQIFYVLASSEISWLGDATATTTNTNTTAHREKEGYEGHGGFHMMGYSFGGGLAASFASYFPHAVRSVTFIAPGGLMPWNGNSWRTKLLYFTRGIFPENVLQYFVRKRFEPVAPSIKQAALVEQAETGSDPFDNAVVATRKRAVGDGTQVQANVTVADVMAWQLRHHRGFIPAVMSAFRYGPIHERYEEWGRLAEFLAVRRRIPKQPQPRQAGEEKGAATKLPGLLGGRVLLVLGSSDPIVREERLVPEMRRVLGEKAVEVVVLDAGHEVAITKGAEIAGAAVEFWNAHSHADLDE